MAPHSLYGALLFTRCQMTILLGLWSKVVDYVGSRVPFGAPTQIKGRVSEVLSAGTASGEDTEHHCSLWKVYGLYSLPYSTLHPNIVSFIVSYWISIRSYLLPKKYFFRVWSSDNKLPRLHSSLSHYLYLLSFSFFCSLFFSMLLCYCLSFCLNS